MVTTRTRERANSNADADGKTETPVSGKKRNVGKDGASISPDAKRAKKSDDATSRQTTLEETLEKQNDTNFKTGKEEEAADIEMKDREDKDAEESKKTREEIKKEVREEMKEELKSETEKEEKSNAVEENGKAENDKEQVEEKAKAEAAITNNGKGETAELPHKDTNVPSNILEKGIIYFFFRARVNLDKAEEVDDIARSYIILRPIGTDSKLGDGPIGDAGNTRLLALPKKVLPESGKDRFMVFVEKSGASFADLREEFLSGADNETKAGTSHSPAATPAGEGVYVITTTGRESHLAYMLTLPSELGEVQKELGLKEQGSFILSTKNPKFPGPANASLPKAPDFTQKIKDDFRDLRWQPSKPEHLDFANAQILMIGESSGIEKAVEPKKKDVKEGKDEPKEVLEQIEDEDTKRMKDLTGDDSASIFADLQARAKDYPKLQTTF